MRWLWRIACIALVLLAVVGLSALAHRHTVRQRTIAAARLAIVPLMTARQFRQSAQGVGFDARTRDVSFTVKGTRWTAHPAPPPDGVPSLARQGKLLASVQGEVLYPGDIGKLLGAMPAQVATYEFAGRGEAEVRSALEKEGWKTAEAEEAEMRRQARAHGLDPSKLPGGPLKLPGMGGKLLYPPLGNRLEPGSWARGILLSQGGNGAIVQCVAWSTGNIPTTPP
jgi:hypothetical protein